MRSLKHIARKTLLLALAACVTMTACAPDSVPKDASHEWDFINGSVWYWGDKLASGCTSWMASERWVSVYLVIDSDCDASRQPYQIEGEKVGYADYADVLEFSNYGPWSFEIREELAVFDDQGKFLGFKPCPHTVTPEDISNMTSLAMQASAIATTDGEKKIMERVKERFDVVDINALSSEQFGCTDDPLRRADETTDISSSQ